MTDELDPIPNVALDSPIGKKLLQHAMYSDADFVGCPISFTDVLWTIWMHSEDYKKDLNVLRDLIFEWLTYEDEQYRLASAKIYEEEQA